MVKRIFENAASWEVLKISRGQVEVSLSSNYLNISYQHLLTFPVLFRNFGYHPIAGPNIIRSSMSLRSYWNFTSVSSRVLSLTQLEDLRSQIALKASNLALISIVSILAYQVSISNFKVSNYGSWVSSKFKCIKFHSCVCRVKTSYNLVIL